MHWGDGYCGIYISKQILQGMLDAVKFQDSTDLEPTNQKVVMGSLFLLLGKGYRQPKNLNRKRLLYWHNNSKNDNDDDFMTTKKKKNYYYYDERFFIKWQIFELRKKNLSVQIYIYMYIYIKNTDDNYYSNNYW